MEVSVLTPKRKGILTINRDPQDLTHKNLLGGPEISWSTLTLRWVSVAEFVIIVIVVN
jgi:hypothetical protein